MGDIVSQLDAACHGEIVLNIVSLIDLNLINMRCERYTVDLYSGQFYLCKFKRCGRFFN